MPSSPPALLLPHLRPSSPRGSSGARGMLPTLSWPSAPGSSSQLEEEATPSAPPPTSAGPELSCPEALPLTPWQRCQGGKRRGGQGRSEEEASANLSWVAARRERWVPRFLGSQRTQWGDGRRRTRRREQRTRCLPVRRASLKSPTAPPPPPPPPPPLHLPGRKGRHPSPHPPFQWLPPQPRRYLLSCRLSEERSSSIAFPQSGSLLKSRVEDPSQTFSLYLGPSDLHDSPAAAPPHPASWPWLQGGEECFLPGPARRPPPHAPAAPRTAL
mmetsp:Transcript_47603/g.149189  ORF Transcript_47603/g.149189 Transcript_47603/m.149189 type:complete len:271 (+) Transcript_47603:575-1387(+)